MYCLSSGRLVGFKKVEGGILEAYVVGDDAAILTDEESRELADMSALAK